MAELYKWKKDEAKKYLSLQVNEGR